VQLPGMDGRAALKLLKADVSTQHIPIIALTAFAMKGDQESLQTEGFDGYMAKPIDIKELPKIIARFCTRNPQGQG
jgi:two-component system, cell cycle response regulator DivK